LSEVSYVEHPLIKIGRADPRSCEKGEAERC